MAKMTKKSNEEESIMIDKITTDLAVKARFEQSPETIEEYAAAMKRGDKFPAIVVFRDATGIYLADGYHRLSAEVYLGRKEIRAEIYSGTKRDAILYSLKANRTHGLRMTNADKRCSTLVLLEDEEWKKWTDRKIAEHCGVSHTFVSNLKKEISGNGCQLNLPFSGTESVPASSPDEQHSAVSLVGTNPESRDEPLDSVTASTTPKPLKEDEEIAKLKTEFQRLVGELNELLKLWQVCKTKGIVDDEALRTYGMEGLRETLESFWESNETA